MSITINETDFQALMAFLSKQPYETAAPLIDFFHKKKQEHAKKEETILEEDKDEVHSS